MNKQRCFICDAVLGADQRSKKINGSWRRLCPQCKLGSNALNRVVEVVV